MSVHTLTLTGFRSYGEIMLEMSDGPQVLTGPNAAGKTNLVEAIVLLGTGRSHRGATDAEMISWGHRFARLEARVGRDLTPATSPAPGLPSRAEDHLEVLLHAPGSGLRRRSAVNGIPRRSLALGTVLRSVLFSPEDMLLVTGTPALRRAALDDLVVQRVPLASSSMAAYGRALAQRNALLRSIRDEPSRRDELAYWDGLVCREGGQIMGWRRDVLADLTEPLTRAHSAIAPTEPPLSLGYVCSVPSEEGEDLSGAMSRRLVQLGDKEIWNGATLVGPHRDDIRFELGGRDMAGFASRGQQRSAILALKLAQVELLARHDGRQPLLLLDDVFSELDPDRRSHLVRVVRHLPQAIITTTSLDDLDPGLLEMATPWRVEHGQVSPASAGIRSRAARA